MTIEIVQPSSRDRYVYAFYANGETLPCYIGVGKGYRIRDSAKRRGLLTAAAHKIVTNATVGEAYAVEVALIKHYGRIEFGGRLLNIDAGGSGSSNRAPSTLAKLSERARVQKHQPHSLETRLKIAAAGRGRQKSSVTRAKLAAAMLGKKLPPQVIEKVAAAKRGKPLSAEHRAKLSAALSGQGNGFFGKKHSPDTIAKLSIARRGKPRSPEAIVKAAASNRGKKRLPFSAEKRANMSAAHLGKRPAQETRIKMAESARRVWSTRKMVSL